MQIKTLKLSNFRCYDHIELDFEQRINVFYGDNGSGKTSLLEAIYFLSTGKSFRSKRNKNLIKHEQEVCSVFAALKDSDQQTHKIGIALTRQLKKQLKFNDNNINNQSDVAHRVPVVSIDPDSYLFLDKPPQFRRSFFDWLVFHVKPAYLEIWSKTSRCHKHLNSLYKEKKQLDLDYWEQQYINYANQLTQMRSSVYQQLNTMVMQQLNVFMPELDDLNLSFKQGWGVDIPLADQIKSDRAKNLLYGSLQAGVHKMDIKTSTNNQAAHEQLSRGQKKIVSSLFYLSLIELISEQLGVHPILCLDDMDAELDVKKTAVFSQFIQSSSNQIFITTVQKDKLTSTLSSPAMFHVKHNQVVATS